jgi:hypothetical protein
MFNRVEDGRAFAVDVERRFSRLQQATRIHPDLSRSARFK